jgi:hypothetical protein
MRHKARAVLGVVFGFAVQKGWLTINPVSKPKRGGTRAERMERGSGGTKDRKRYPEREGTRPAVDRDPRAVADHGRGHGADGVVTG